MKNQMFDFKEFRRINNLSQKEASEYFGVNQAFLSQLEHGKREVPEKYISKILADGLYKMPEENASSEEPAPTTPHVTQNNNQGDNNYNSDIIQLFKESQNQLTTSQAQLTTAQEQINQLITIIASKL